MKTNVITQVYLEDPEILQVLAPVISKAPRGIRSLAALQPDLIKKMITHPYTVVGVQPDSFFIPLSNVDTTGYTVYDKTFTDMYTVEKDFEYNPDDDLSVPHLRPMRFGSHIYDIAWIRQLKHGDFFYIGYSSDTLLPALYLVVMFHEAVVGDI